MSNEQTVINMLKKLEQDIAQIKQDQVTESLFMRCMDALVAENQEIKELITKTNK